MHVKTRNNKDMFDRREIRERKARERVNERRVGETDCVVKG